MLTILRKKENGSLWSLSNFYSFQLLFLICHLTLEINKKDSLLNPFMFRFNPEFNKCFKKTN